MEINIEKYFSRHMMDKGYDYYLQDRVSNVCIKEKIITATVIGTHDYDIRIILDENNNEIKTANCNCPYAAGDGDCKHVVSVLYYINNMDSNEVKNVKANNVSKEDELKSIIKQLSKQEIENYVINLLLNDNEIYEDFRLEFISKFSKLSIPEYKRKIKNTIKQLEGRHGFIDYTTSRYYPQAMWNFTQEARSMLDNNEYELAFDILIVILDEIPDLHIDDSNGETGEVSYKCIEIIGEIINVCANDTTEKSKILDKIYKYIVDEIETETLSNYGVELYELISVFVDNKIYLN